MDQEAALGNEIRTISQLLTCNIDDELRTEMEGRLTDALKHKAKAEIVREARERIAAVRVVCGSCAYSTRCCACPVEAHSQRIAQEAQASVFGLGKRERVGAVE